MYVTDRRHKLGTLGSHEHERECQGEVALRHQRLIAEWSTPPAIEDSEDSDHRISAALIPLLWALYGDSDEEVRTHLERFREANREHLCFVAQQHADDQRVGPLLHQPELPLILDRLEADPRGLLEVWPLTVPRTWLEALADAWGSPL
jgi:hypothetical protein